MGVKMYQISRRLQILIDRHQALDDKIDEMSNWNIIFPSEQEYLKQLKVTRLRAKEAIDRFRLEEGIPE
jgi:hypothetical protein